jgi:fatty acid desaturase
VYLLLGGTAWYFFSIQAWVLISLANFGVFFATFLGKFCGVIQHRGLPPNQPDWRLSCHTVKLGPLLRYLYWNMNYYIEHHMYAAVPFYNTPALHEALNHDLPAQHQGLLFTLRLRVDVKKKQATDPDYYYKPEFPAGAAAPKRA